MILVSTWGSGTSWASFRVVSLFSVLTCFILVGTVGGTRQGRCGTVDDVPGAYRRLGSGALTAGVMVLVVFITDGVSVWRMTMITLRMCVTTAG